MSLRGQIAQKGEEAWHKGRYSMLTRGNRIGYPKRYANWQESVEIVLLTTSYSLSLSGERKIARSMVGKV